MSLNAPISRRRLLSRTAQGLSTLGAGLFGGAAVVGVAQAEGADAFGPLLDPDENGLRLPAGFSSRIVAITGKPVGDTAHTWHAWPDGGATYETQDGGWVYVSNAEVSHQGGGVGAIRFDRGGAITDAYSILKGTNRNCAGGPTPWKTWLSCEEVDKGRVFECDPFSPGSSGVAREAMGVFAHEAAAVDSVHQCIYLTEDKPDGLLYRFRPARYPDLSAGLLEAAQVVGPSSADVVSSGEVHSLAWHTVPDPAATTQPTRKQVALATPFRGGEGCWYEGGHVFFSTKGDNRVWQIDTARNQLSLVYDLATSETPLLSGVDNVYGVSNGDVYVAEDGGDLEIVALTPSGAVRPIVQVTGQPNSEVTGPALSPDGTRLYFSSQRTPGTTYEVTGPFLASLGVSLDSRPALGWLAPLVLGAAAYQAWRRRSAISPGDSSS